MDPQELLAQRFEAHRPRLRAVAYRMLGSVSEADDAVQEGWLRLSRADTVGVDNLAGWLTTVVSRICLDMLRARRARREESLSERLPDPIVTGGEGADPEHAALRADAVGLALLVVLDTLTPAERLAFVLHDMFAVPFDQIAPIVDRSPDATKMMASRARRRVQRSAPTQDPDLSRQREVVDAFHAAARGGGFTALVAVLDPGVVLRADRAEGLLTVRGATAVANQAMLFARLAPLARPAIVNGAAGAVSILDGDVLSVMAFTVSAGLISEIDVYADRDRIARLGIGHFG